MLCGWVRKGASVCAGGFASNADSQKLYSLFGLLTKIVWRT